MVRTPSQLDRDPAAHERRVRLIAELHEQAIATANDLSARHKAIRADFARDARRRTGCGPVFFRRCLPLGAWLHRRRELYPRGLALMASLLWVVGWGAGRRHARASKRPCRAENALSRPRSGQAVTFRSGARSVCSLASRGTRGAAVEPCQALPFKNFAKRKPSTSDPRPGAAL